MDMVTYTQSDAVVVFGISNDAYITVSQK